MFNQRRWDDFEKEGGGGDVKQIRRQNKTWRTRVGFKQKNKRQKECKQPMFKNKGKGNETSMKGRFK
jgi:hypothetical protein